MAPVFLAFFAGGFLPVAAPDFAAEALAGDLGGTGGFGGALALGDDGGRWPGETEGVDDIVSKDTAEKYLLFVHAQPVQQLL